MRKARKPHRCDECGRAIEPGEFYHYGVCVTDGDAFINKCCAQCTVAQRWPVDNCGGYVFGEVYEEIVEHAREYPTLAMPLLRLAAGMRRKWKSFRTDALMPEMVTPPSIASYVKGS